MGAKNAQLLTQVRQAGYETLRVEQPRPNRWLLTLRTPEGGELLAMAQQRPLISAADVQDLAELLRLRRMPSGMLLALGGRFSPEAQRTALELRRPRIQLCVELPAAANGALGLSSLEAARQ